MRVMVWCGLLLLTGCYQVHHTTHVRDGVRTELAGGVVNVKPRPQPPDTPDNKRTGVDALFGIGYGKRSGRSAYLVHATIPITTFFYDAIPDQKGPPYWSLPSLTYFVQSDTPDGMISYGGGGILGLRPAAYAQVGYNGAVSVDAGARVDVARAVAVYGVLTARVGSIEIGAWAEPMWYLVDPESGDDPTDADYSERRVTAGLLVRAFSH